ncbi:MAG: hypothetical protein R3E31_11300 [Chloroflexota bacterium]
MADAVELDCCRRYPDDSHCEHGNRVANHGYLAGRPPLLGVFDLPGDNGRSFCHLRVWRAVHDVGVLPVCHIPGARLQEIGREFLGGQHPGIVAWLRFTLPLLLVVAVAAITNNVFPNPFGASLALVDRAIHVARTYEGDLFAWAWSKVKTMLALAPSAINLMALIH